MYVVVSRILRGAAALALALTALAGHARAAPRVTLVPPPGARFLPGQRFDVRLEVDAPTAAATLTLDGRPVPFTSGAPDGADGISPAGLAGFNVRGLTVQRPGRHVLRADVIAAGGAVTVERTFEVVALHGAGRGEGRVRNVILFLGDGMGIAHRTAARIVGHGVADGDPRGRLAMDELPGTGFVSTHSLNSIVTDSAPGMSCYTTGNHQNNNQEGVWPARVTNPFYAPRVEYLGAYLHRTRGTALGLVSTADLEDATPAANAVHTANRGAGTGIVDQYLDEADVHGARTHGSGLAVLLGGGRRWFAPETNPLSSRASATDYAALPADLLAAWRLPAQAAGALDPRRDLVADFRTAGFEYVESRTQLETTLRGQPDRLLGLFAWGNMNTAHDKIAERRGDPTVVNDHLAPDQPMLDEMTDAALRVLARHREGFVLMVEGAHIDKQSHAMDADRAIGETLELDRAVARGLEFAKRDGRTLVLVTGDHECSGFSLIGALTGATVAQLRAAPSDAANVSPDPASNPSTQPLRQRAVGVYDGAGFPQYTIAPDGYPVSWDVDGKVLVGFGANADRFEGWLSEPRPIIESLTPAALRTSLAGKGYPATAFARSPEGQTGFFVRGQVSDRRTAVHTASDIPISAYAAEEDVWRSFVGAQTNTDVFFKIAGAVLGSAR
jgi:alkaline phosphatase